MTIPCKTSSLWKVVKTACDVNVSPMPNVLYLDGVLVPDKEVHGAFPAFFDNKIRKILDEVQIDKDIYNGKKW
jgi:hypothetical protein